MEHRQIAGHTDQNTQHSPFRAGAQQRRVSGVLHLAAGTEDEARQGPFRGKYGDASLSSYTETVSLEAMA